MSYSDIERTFLRARRKAVKRGLPEWALRHVDALHGMAKFRRDRSHDLQFDREHRDRDAARGVNEMFNALHVVRSFLVMRPVVDLRWADLQAAPASAVLTNEACSAQTSRKSGA
ncbi:hypothetical protein [Cupriavidus sp. YAF13]|uniref:hypothetical protein n=1 Tax=Cupriavidus sp. YAF13 TaxID=3233075 RepID=UPI003F8EB982